MAVMPVDNMLTRDELDALPDNGLRHELIDGAFVMTPSPTSGHQGMVGGLYVALRAACLGTDLRVRFAPLDVALGSSVVEPDLMVAPVSATLSDTTSSPGFAASHTVAPALSALRIVPSKHAMSEGPCDPQASTAVMPAGAVPDQTH